MAVEFLPITKDNIKSTPDRFSTIIDGKAFIFQISYMQKVDAFYFDMLDNEGNDILRGRRICYGEDLLSNVVNDLTENIQLVPIAQFEEFEATGITFENFYNNVFVYVVVSDE